MDARPKIDSLLELLRNTAGLDLAARIEQSAPVVSGESGDLPELLVELTGSDTPLLTERNGELLHAIEHIAAKMLGLEPEEHHRISFDADCFKAKRNEQLHRLANAAILRVRSTSVPYTFPPMMSRERRLLHLALAPSGLQSASIGESSRRSVVLYPEGVAPPA